VFAHIESTSDIFHSDKSVSVLIHAAEGALDHSQLALGKLVTEASNELLVIDAAIAIDVVGAHEAL